MEKTQIRQPPDQKYLFPADHTGPLLCRLVTIDGLYKDVVVKQSQRYYETISSFGSLWELNTEGQLPTAQEYHRRVYKAERFTFRKVFKIDELHMSDEEIFDFINQLRKEYPYGPFVLGESQGFYGKNLTIAANAVEYREIPPEKQIVILVHDGVFKAIARSAKSWLGWWRNKLEGIRGEKIPS